MKTIPNLETVLADSKAVNYFKTTTKNNYDEYIRRFPPQADVYESGSVRTDAVKIPSYTGLRTQSVNLINSHQVDRLRTIAVISSHG